MHRDRLVSRRRGVVIGALLAVAAGGAAQTARASTSVLGPALGGYSAELQLSPDCRLGDFDEAGSLCLFDGVSAGIALDNPYMILGSGETPAVLGIRGGAGLFVPRSGLEEQRSLLETLTDVKLSSIELGVSISGGPVAGVELRGRFGLMFGASLFGDMSLSGSF